MRTQSSKASTPMFLARALGVALVFGVGAVACGSDDDATTQSHATTQSDATDETSTSTDLDDTHQLILDRTLALAEDNGFDFDEGCVRDIVAQLSDEDAALLAASSSDEDPQLSEQGEALGDSLQTCAIASTNSALVEEAADKAIANEDSLDPDCVRENFAKLSDDQLQLWIDSAPDSTDPKLIAIGFSVLDCINFDNTASTPAS